MKLSEEPHQHYERSLFLFRSEDKAINTFLEFLLRIKKPQYLNTTGVVVTTESILKTHKFQKISQNVSSFKNIQILTFNGVSNILGMTTDFLFIDLRANFNPNKISILFETVRGGGIIFLLGLPYADWSDSINKKRLYLEKEISKESDIKKSILLKWFLTNIQDNGTMKIDSFSIKDVIEHFNPMPFSINLNARIRNFDVTSEQKELIRNLLKDLFDSTHANSCSVLLANRGRGKSAAVGLILAEFLLKRKSRSLKVTISSPNPQNVQTLFDFLSRGLISHKKKFRTIRKGGLINEIKISNIIRFHYLWPSEVDRTLKSDIIIIDEAAAIPVEILKETLRITNKKIFISTIHGYEGASRGFQYKIVNYLRNQKEIKFREYSLSQPIRYLLNDPIEELLNKTFLLNVEIDPLEVPFQEIKQENITLQKYSDSDYLFSNQGLSKLKQLFGIMICAHYRNQPNDLLLIADSNKHFLIGFYVLNDQNEKILVGSSQLAKEGKMSEHEINRVVSGEFIEGNIIANVAIRHFSPDFANFQGIRIVRIASHPSLIGKGYGRKALEKLIQEFTSYDWIGVSFGATVKLMKFWIKFGFRIVHIRPTKTIETGEWNVVVICGNSPQIRRIIDQASADFKLQFLSLLKHSLHSMKPELVQQILKSCSLPPAYTPKITSSGSFRLQNYLKGNINFLLAIDVIHELTLAYFLSPSLIKLSTSQELLLISRILQGRTWGQTLGRTGLNWKAANGLIEKAVNKLASVYL